MRRSYDGRTRCKADHKQLRNRRSVPLSWPIAAHHADPRFFGSLPGMPAYISGCLLLLGLAGCPNRRSDQLPHSSSFDRDALLDARGRGSLLLFLLQRTNLAARTIELLQPERLERAYRDPSCFSTSCEFKRHLVDCFAAGILLIRVRINISLLAKAVTGNGEHFPASHLGFNPSIQAAVSPRQSRWASIHSRMENGRCIPGMPEWPLTLSH